RLGLVGVTLFDCFRDRVADRSAPRTVSVLPGEAILLSGGADDALGVLVHLRIFMLLLGVLMLRLHEAAANRDVFEFVGADAAVQDFLPAQVGIKRPLSLVFDQGDRQGRLVRSKGDGSAIGIVHERNDRVFLLGLGRELHGV